MKRWGVGVAYVAVAGRAVADRYPAAQTTTVVFILATTLFGERLNSIGNLGAMLLLGALALLIASSAIPARSPSGHHQSEPLIPLDK